MGFFSKLFGGARPEQSDADPWETLAKELLEAFRSVGGATNFVYDPKERCLREGGDPKGHTVFLGNLMEELKNAPSSMRREVVERFARGMIPITLPETWAEAADNVLPRVVDRAYYAFADLHAQAQGMELAKAMSFIPLTDDLGLSLVVDLPHTIASLSLEKLAEWQVPVERAMEIATENLARRSRESFVAQGPVFVSPWKDNHDASRMTLIETISALPVKGDHVALAPHRDHLFITGTDDVAGLNALCDRAEELAAGPRYMGFLPARLVNGRWTSFALPRDHPCWSRFTEMALKEKVRVYGQQKQLLDESLPVFVATFKALKTKEGSFITAAIWTRGVPSLLPRTEKIFFVDPGKETFLLNWEDAEAVLGSLHARTDLYPVRHDATREISAEEWARLRTAAKQGQA